MSDRVLVAVDVECGGLVTAEGVTVVPRSVEITDCDGVERLLPKPPFRFSARAGECHLEQGDNVVIWRCPEGMTLPNGLRPPTGDAASLHPGESTQAEIQITNSWYDRSVLSRGYGISSRRCLETVGYCDFVRPDSTEYAPYQGAGQDVE